MRLLVVDDNAETVAFLKRSFEAETHAVDVAYDGERGSYAARTNEYDAIILDNVLPRKNGLQVCREIRAAGKTVPIIMLSALSDTDEKVGLLDAGADDYLTKPYSFEELRARVTAQSRSRLQTGKHVISVDGLDIDADRREISYRGMPVYMTRKEFSLLLLLAENLDTIVSRGAIMEHVWDMTGNPLSRTIETHILNIRKKIAEAGGEAHIVCVPGRGYKMEKPKDSVTRQNQI